MTLWWSIAGGLASVAVGAGIADRRRSTRRDLDRVGVVDWPAVQLFAAAAAILAISLALHV